MPGRIHRREFKLEVVRPIATGENRPAQVCREHQLAESLLLRGRREYEVRGEAAFRPSDVIFSILSSLGSTRPVLNLSARAASD